MLPRDQLAIEMLIVGGVLFENEGTPGHQEREAIGGHCPIDTDLVLVLSEKMEEKGKTRRYDS